MRSRKRASFSTTRIPRPARARTPPRVDPAMPPPTMTTSKTGADMDDPLLEERRTASVARNRYSTAHSLLNLWLRRNTTCQHTAKRRQVQRLRASLVGVCLPPAFGIAPVHVRHSERTPSVPLCQDL